MSDFIRDAVLDKRLTQRQVVEIEPYKIDNSRLIPQVIDAIHTYDFRFVRAITAFEEAGGDGIGGMQLWLLYSPCFK